MKKFFIKLSVFLIAAFAAYCLAIAFLSSNYAPVFLKRNVLYTRGGYGHTLTRLRDADTSSMFHFGSWDHRMPIAVSTCGYFKSTE